MSAKKTPPRARINKGITKRKSSKSRGSKQSSGNYTFIIVLALLIAGVVGFWQPLKSALLENINKKHQEGEEKIEVVQITQRINSRGEIDTERQIGSGGKATKAAGSNNSRPGDSEASDILRQSDKLIAAGKFGEAYGLIAQISSLKINRQLKEKTHKHFKFIRFLESVSNNNPALSDSGEDRKSLQKQLEEKKVTTPGKGIELWKLACFALQNDLRPEAGALLKEAWNLDPKLQESIYEAKAKKLMVDAMYYRSLDDYANAGKKFSELFDKYSKSKAAAIAKEMLAEENKFAARSQQSQKSRSVTNSVAAANTVKTASKTRTVTRVRSRRVVKIKSSDPLVREAEKMYTDATKLYSKGIQERNVGKGRKMMDDAIVKFEKSIKLFSKVVRKYPGKKEYQQRLKSAKAKRGWAGRFNRVG